MAFELLDDVTPVVLGGIDKKTGKKNPTELEGYFLRVEQRVNKFNKNKPQNYYIFQTAAGDKGLYGKAGLDREMKKATIGTMLKVVNTGQTIDTGMGNPMVVFKVYQDKTQTIDVTSHNPTIQSAPAEEEIAEMDEYTDSSLDEEETQELPPVKVAAARPAPKTVDPARAARVQALLAKKS